MAPTFDPLDPLIVEVKATSARPLTGLIPTAWGARGNAVPPKLADGKVRRDITLGTLRSTTASVPLALFATRARLRRLSTATETGAVAVRPVQGSAPPSVQSEGVMAVRVARLISVMSFESRFATTATPVAV